MKTHTIITFSKQRIKINHNQAALVMDMLEHKEELKDKDYLRFEDQIVYLKSISEVIALPYAEREGAEKVCPSLPEPKNRFTRQENIQRMKIAAYKAKKIEQEKYGIQSWSTLLENWLPENYQSLS